VNNSPRRGRRMITNIRGQERIKFQRRIDEPMRARKLSSIINSVSQQNLKMSNSQSKAQWIRSSGSIRERAASSAMPCGFACNNVLWANLIFFLTGLLDYWKVKYSRQYLSETKVHLDMFDHVSWSRGQWEKITPSENA
jgi:hypothetical protein